MYNGTKLLIMHLGDWLIEVKVIIGRNISAKVLISQIVLIAKNSK